MNDMDQLREDVRATAPTPSLEFAARMDRQVEAGFTRDAREPRERRRINLWAPGLALACTAAVAIVFGLLSLGGDEQGGLVDASRSDPQMDRLQRELERDGGQFDDDANASGGRSAQSGDYSAQFAAPAAGSVSELSADAGGGGAQRQRGRGESRVVEQRTALELQTGADDFQETADDVLQLADDHGAIVQSSRVSERDGRAFARYDLRVPSSRLDDTLADLTRLAHVTSRSSSSQDITRAYVSATDRLDDARAERNALLKALEKADTDVEAEAIRRQIALARNRIAIAQRDVDALQRRADRSKVSVTLRSTGRKSEDEGGAWTPGDALDDAGRILEVAAGVVVVTAAVLLPVGVLALLAGIAARTVRRRRRDAALDAG